ncbi:efflux RND transporter periplasmic adaptor subunit [Paenibacillus sp. WQ 127069]|uniref:Efflux RND transporter periplasmic adaptor subunit n=1 Tax=Paenibacillus baimaensis TaxID=2982185 RepID=A0ABT2URF9_9BACL|nr:efflux RND transporter periplasmic adaptor subunit [Paenibacillus sp. WQ 127069]MCU6797245.1 efflux RND transporter periplasmic adaptor subunit [Paenibacillus sp. WQ 127069]
MKSRYKIGIIVASVLVLCGAGAYWYVYSQPKSQTANPQEKVLTIKKGTIRSVVSGTSQFEARDMQNIIATADGTIKTMNLTRNQAVSKGDVLLEISVPSQEISLQEAESTLVQLQKDLSELQNQQNHLQIVAPLSGTLSLSSNLDVGSNVGKTSRFATLSDSSTLITKLSFVLENAVQLKKGDLIDLTVDGFNLTKTAKVEAIGTQPKADANGGKLLEVDIKVTNDGTLAVGMKVKGSLQLNGRLVESSDKGVLDYNSIETILTSASGVIKELKVKTGSYVKQGDVIASLFNDTLQNDIASKSSTIERQKNTINDLQEKVKQLTIRAPFDGVFSTDFANKKSNVLASYPVGSKIEVNTLLGAVASLDYMQLPIQVDELDLPNVKAGMKAAVRVDSISNKVFEGEVNQVSTVGTTTNGVTFFDAVLSVKNTSELRYGMTATAEIIIQDKKNIVLLPIEALQQQQGKRYVTLLKADGTKEERHEIKIGIRSKTDIEVTEGLNEGDQVVAASRQRTQNASQADIDRLRQQFQGGAGGAGAGGFPAGPGGGGGAGAGGTGGGNQRTGGNNR